MEKLRLFSDNKPPKADLAWTVFFCLSSPSLVHACVWSVQHLDAPLSLPCVYMIGSWPSELYCECPV